MQSPESVKEDVPCIFLSLTTFPSPAVIYRYAGCDATKAYNEIHAPNLIHEELSHSLIGRLDTSSITEEWAKPPPSTLVEFAPGEKPPLETLINSYDFEDVASKTISPKTWAFYSSSATDTITHRANKGMFDRIWLRPRVLRDVRTVSTRARILGHDMEMPIFCSPAAMAKMIHPDGEKALAKGCANQGIIQCVRLCSLLLPLCPY